MRNRKRNIFLEEKAPPISEINELLSISISLNAEAKFEQSNTCLIGIYHNFMNYWLSTKYHIALNHKALHQFEPAKESFKRIIAFLEEENPSLNVQTTLCQTHLDLGYTLEEMGDFNTAKSHFVKSLELAEKIKNGYMQFCGHFHLGLHSKNPAEIDNGIRHLKKALIFAHHSKEELFCQRQLGIFYFIKKDYHEAYTWLSRAIASIKEHKITPLLSEESQAELNHFFGLCCLKNAIRALDPIDKNIFYKKQARYYLATSLSYYRSQKNNENTTKKKAITGFLLSVTLLKLQDTEPFNMYLHRSIEELNALPKETQRLVFSKIEEYLGENVMNELCKAAKTFNELYKQHKLQKKDEEGSEINIIRTLNKSAKKILERKDEIASSVASLPQIPKERKKTLESPLISLKSWECDNPEIKFDEGLFLFLNKKHAASNQHLIPLYETIRTSLGHTIYFLGINFGATDDLDNAIRYYKKNKIILSKRNPSHKEALLATLAQLGICYYRKNDIPKATETLKEAALIISTLDASHGIPAKDIRNIYDYLGRCYLKNKESNASITCFKSAKKYSENSEDERLINRQIMDAMLTSKKSGPEVEHHSVLRRVKSALL